MKNLNMQMAGKNGGAYDWLSEIRTNLMVLRLMGLWPQGDKDYEPGLYTLYMILATSILAFGHISFQAINIYFIVSNLQSFVKTSYLILMEMLGAIKAYYLVKNMKILKVRLNTFKSDWFQPRNLQQKKLIEPNIQFWKKVCMSFVIMCFGCNTFWATFPLLDKSAYSEERRLPFLGWYPYNYKVSPWFEITYVYQVVSTFYLTAIHGTVDTLVSAFNIYTACQIDMLCDNLRHMTDIEPKSEENIFKEMMKCVSHHKNILYFIDDSTKFHNWILFWHFLFSGVSIGITMFALTLVDPMSGEFYSLVTYLFAIIIQIFLYCWFASEVQAASDKLSYAAFESYWTDLSEGLKKKLLFFSMQVHKPLKISALNLFVYSLDTYMRIMKTAWSYFAFLYQVNSRK